MDLMSLQMTMQRALLGRVTPNLRAVCINLNEDLIRLTYYYNDPPSDYESNLAIMAGREVTKEVRFPQYRVSYHIHIHPCPHKIPQNGVCVYRRYESDLCANKKIKTKLMDIASIKLSMLHALVGRVTSNVRAIYVYALDDCAHLIYYYNESPSKKEHELAAQVERDFIADYSPQEYSSKLQFIIHQSPQKINSNGICVYARHEPR